MGYYQIKCINCGQVIPTAKVVYRMTEDGLDESDADLFRATDDAEEEDSFGYDDLISMDTNDDQGPKCTYADCGKLLGFVKKYKERNIDIGSVEAIVENVFNISEVAATTNIRNQRKMRPEMLQSGIRLHNFKINGKVLNGEMTRRYCPVCHYPLSEHSGRIPTYTIGVMGHSTVGKTVYFTVLHDRLSQTIPVTGGILHSSVDLSHLSGDKAEFEKFWEDLYTRRELPGSTQDNSLQEPYCRVISYCMNGSTKDNNRCLLAVRDVVGEALTGESKDRRQREAVAFGNQADALIVMVDPMTLVLPRNMLPKESRGNQNEGFLALDQYKRTLGRLRDTETKPCAVLLTKEDILLQYSMVLRIPRDQPAIAQGMNPTVTDGRDWYREFMGPVDASTRATIRYLDQGEGTFSFLERRFNQALFLPISALGNTSRIEVQQNGVCKVMGEINPRFVEVPILYLLMKFNIIPPAYLPEFSSDQRAIMEEWCRRYAQYTEPAPPPPMKEKPRQGKKGLFSRRK